MAVLSSRVASQINRSSELTVQQWILPRISFETEEFTRRSMSLNGMRMGTEYLASGSLRVLQLIEQRLLARQCDVVHDVLVYLMEQVLDLRTEAREARLLHAESVAAYLGLHPEHVSRLFLAPRLAPVEITTALEAGTAGKIRRVIDVASLVESQVRHLRLALRHHLRQERRILQLIDEVARLLYQNSNV
jgi:hypothetical protein